MNFVSHLQCTSCRKHFDHDHLWNLCPACNHPLVIIYDLRQIRKVLSRDDLKSRESNIWRYQELLPVEGNDILSLGEGFTPLIPVQGLSRFLQFDNLYIKDEGQNPTGSFKARGMAVAVSKAKALGIKELSIPTAGNAGSAMSCYAALAGLKASVFMPIDVPEIFVIECKNFGAEVRLIDGMISDCAKVAAGELRNNNRFDMSTLKEPYRVEGKKTLGFEIAEQMDWKLPDVIIYPTGGGTGLIGMWKAFEEMERLGWIGSERPRMVSVQAESCKPIVKAFEERKKETAPWPSWPKTIAEGLRVPKPIGDFLILRVLYESRGIAVAVSDDEIMDSIDLIGRAQGIFACPEGAATLAAFKKLRHDGWIRESERVVLFNTATGLKYTHLWRKT